MSERGQRQALWLVGQLSGHGVTRLLSSPYLRCTQSLEPLASALGLRIERERSLAEGQDPAACLAMLASLGTVACTHGDVVDGVLASYARRGLRTDRDATPKGGLWIVEADGVRLITPPN